jgi:hypothetical protein
LTGTQSLLARTALGCLVGGISVWISSISSLFTLASRSFDRAITLAFIASRLAIYTVIFLVLRIAPRGDVPAFYWSESNEVLAHLLPYRDFQSSYAPLHPYLNALVILIWHSPLAIILLAIIAEAFVLPLWLRLGRVFLEERDLRSASLLYLTSVISLHFVAIDGHDNVVIALLLVLALFFIHRSRIFASGAAVGVAFSTIKFLPLLYMPIFVTLVPRRWRWLAGASAIILPVFGVCLFVLRLPILTPLLFEKTMTSAGNIPYVFEGITGLAVPTQIWDALVFLALAAVFFLIVIKTRGARDTQRLRLLTFGFAALTLTLVLFSKKSWPPYLMLCLFPICLLMKNFSRLRVLAFAIFGVVAVTADSYWATVLGQAVSAEFHRGLLAHRSDCLILLVLQIALVGGYLWLLQLAIREICNDQLSAINSQQILQAVSVSS